jgi:hypothetical protein
MRGLFAAGSSSRQEAVAPLGQQRAAKSFATAHPLGPLSSPTECPLFANYPTKASAKLSEPNASFIYFRKNFVCQGDPVFYCKV